MPKRGRGNNRVWNNDSDNRGPRDSRHDGGKYYYEHDERNSDFTRRVSFKAGTSNRVGKPRRNQADWDAQLQARLTHVADDDVDMNNQPGYSNKNGRRFNPYVAGRGRGGRGRGGGGRGGRQHSPTPAAVLQRRPQLLESATTWYKVMIPHGNKYDKDYIVTTLQNIIAPITMVPFLYKVAGNEASFYLENFQVADAVMNADRKATTSEGFKLMTRVRPGFPPVDPASMPDMKERMKLAMSKRYNPANKALDLERFHMDPSLREDYIAALFRPIVMMAVIDIVAENIPELCALNLGDNRLSTLDHLSCLATKLPALAVLHLGKNKIRDVRQIECLKKSKLVDLVLEGNPLCDKIPNRANYVSEVIKRFPKLRKLDNVDLPPPILFDTGEEESHIPPYNGSFLIAQDGRDFLRQFLEQYIRIYDSDARGPLNEAYHEQATFSLTSAVQNKDNTPNNRLDAYISLSRNLLRVNDPVRRHKLLIRGKENIVTFIDNLPKTMHDAQSFAVDMPIYTPQLIQINVSGMFRERDSHKQPLRSFSRVFIIVPVGAGFCIINETMFVTNVTELQRVAAFKAPAPVAPQPGPAMPSVSAQPDPALKTQMVQALCQQTQMNLTWANKCLEETHWNFDLAVISFVELNKARAIPPEAFVN